jgi:hypothetical protein
MTYVVYNKDYIRHLMNESKNQIFAYISNRRVYTVYIMCKMIIGLEISTNSICIDDDGIGLEFMVIQDTHQFYRPLVRW